MGRPNFLEATLSSPYNAFLYSLLATSKSRASSVEGVKVLLESLLWEACISGDMAGYQIKFLRQMPKELEQGLGAYSAMSS